ncbi:hypothetical protein CEK60_13325 [Halomonas sp. N3-2A]|nr:hypothetical protein CEK60_13325 [Halomonas sp. N3-2A]
MYISNILCGLFIWYVSMINWSMSNGPVSVHTVYSLIVVLALVACAGLSFLSRRASATVNLLLVGLLVFLAVMQSLHVGGGLGLSTFGVFIPLAPVIGFSAFNLWRKRYSQRGLPIVARALLVITPAVVGIYLSVPIIRYALVIA